MIETVHTSLWAPVICNSLKRSYLKLNSKIRSKIFYLLCQIIYHFGEKNFSTKNHLRMISRQHLYIYNNIVQSPDFGEMLEIEYKKKKIDIVKS